MQSNFVSYKYIIYRVSIIQLLQSTVCAVYIHDIVLSVGL